MKDDKAKWVDECGTNEGKSFDVVDNLIQGPPYSNFDYTLAIDHV